MSNINFTDLPIDCKRSVFEFLGDKDLANVRQLNKDYKSIADTKALYSPEVLAVKNKFREYIDVKMKLEKLNEELVPIGSLFAIFVWIITFKSKILSKITDLFCKLFPSIRVEIEAKNEVDSAYKLKIQLLFEYKVCQLKRRKQEAYGKMMSLFGGKNKYEALPVLDISSVKDLNMNFPVIQHDHMTAPIMRGTDSNKCNFFVIRYRNNDRQSKFYNMMGCHTFVETDPKTVSWFIKSNGFGTAIGEGKFIIDRNGEVGSDLFRLVENAIKTKTIQNHEINPVMDYFVIE